MFKNWKLKENVIKVLKTYPVVLSCFFAIGALGIYLVHSSSNEDLILKINLSIAIFLGFALILRALYLKYDNYNKRRHIIYLSICLILSIGYYFTLDPKIDWTIIRTLIILFIQGLLFISLPFIKDDDRAEHFTNKAAGRLIISGVFYGIAYAGVAGILFALEELFGLDISEKVYQDAAIILATTFLPMLWLYGLNYTVEPFKSKLYKVLLSFVCIPLLFVYTAVVYGFIIKIVFDGFAMPSSIIGHLVLWYSFVSIIVIYLARPYKDNSLTKFFYKWYPLISVLPIIIMFIAIFMRINQYAITINRYYLLLGGIWLAVMFGYFIYVRFANKKRLNIIITLTLALFALISIAEPISAETIAETSQLRRLESTVSPYKESGSLDVTTMDDTDIMQAQDILQYLDWYHDEYNHDYSNDKIYDNKITFLTQDEVQAILSVEINRYELTEDAERYYYADMRHEDGVIPPIELEGYKYLFNFDSYDFNNGDTYFFNEYEIEFNDISDDDGRPMSSMLILYKDGTLIEEINLLDCYKDTVLLRRDSFGDETTDLIYETPDQSLKIILYSASFQYDEELYLIWYEGCILFK